MITEQARRDAEIAKSVFHTQRAFHTKQVPVSAKPISASLRDYKQHPNQAAFIEAKTKRKVVRAGRRGGKTVGAATLAVIGFLAGRRVLYAAPTEDQVEKFWFEVKHALRAPIDGNQVYTNETRHVVERPKTENRIRAKTAWDADSLRGDYADLLILDEFQLMSEATWDEVGAPMLLDNNGDAVFIYTPPSVRTAFKSKAKDKRHAAKLYKKAKADSSGRWAVFHFSSHENPFLSREALNEITSDMTALSYEQEILAQDKDDNPNALWTREQIERDRVTAKPDLIRIVTAIDPSATSTGDEAGIITAGIGLCACQGAKELHGFVLDDSSLQASPAGWAQAGVTAYNKWDADKLVAESNNGGEMVATTIKTIKNAPEVKLIHASRGKQTRAEPIAALYEKAKIHHFGSFPRLEDELCLWEPGMDSPNRLDANVWCFTELMLTGKVRAIVAPSDISRESPHTRV